MITAPLNIILHDNQKIINDDPAIRKVIKAGKRFGKTKWLLYAICKAAGLKQNGIFWYLAPTYRQAKNIAWHELNWLLPKNLVRRSVENELFKELITGSRIQLIGADNEDALRGPQLNGFGMDEAAYIDPYVWEGIISGQLVANVGQDRPFAYFISSPNKKGHNWFTNFHMEAKRKMDSGDKDWAAFYYTVFDNPTLNPEEIQKLKENTTDDTWQLEYMAIESAHAGQLYSEFSYANHVGEIDIAA